MVKKRGKRKKRKTKMKFRRAPSKLPANRVVSANQYLHLQRQIDEMKMVPTRGNRQADYYASQGNPYASASAAQREIIDTLRMTPDILKGLEKKEQDTRYRKLLEEQERLRDQIASITPDLPTHRREGTPSRQSDRSRSSYEASAHTSSSSSEGKVQSRRDLFKAGFGKDSGSVWAPGASSSPQTKWGWDDDGD